MQRLHPKYKVDVLRAWAETEASSWGHVGGWQDSGAVAARLPGTLLREGGWAGLETLAPCPPICYWTQCPLSTPVSFLLLVVSWILFNLLDLTVSVIILSSSRVLGLCKHHPGSQRAPSSWEIHHHRDGTQGSLVFKCVLLTMKSFVSLIVKS